MPEYVGPSERSGQYRSRACIFSIPFLQVINVLVSSVGHKNSLLLFLDHSYTVITITTVFFTKDFALKSNLLL